MISGEILTNTSCWSRAFIYCQENGRNVPKRWPSTTCETIRACLSLPASYSLIQEGTTIRILFHGALMCDAVSWYRCVLCGCCTPDNKIDPSRGGVKVSNNRMSLTNSEAIVIALEEKVLFLKAFHKWPVKWRSFAEKWRLLFSQFTHPLSAKATRQLMAKWNDRTVTFLW